jgi:1,4-dihydroxy-2-naphthoate octaprenyltransferase
LAGLILIIPAIRVVITGGRGPSLITVLKATSLTELLVSASLSAGLVIATM